MTRITFIIANTWETTMRMQFENQLHPYRKRTVTIELTPEQEAAIERHCVGSSRGGKDVFEDILECFVEREGAGKGSDE